MNALYDLFALAVVSGAWALAQGTAHAQPTTVYDNTGSIHLDGYGDYNVNQPILGSALHLSQGGTLSTLTYSVFNTSGALGYLQRGTMTFNIYDNTAGHGGPYTGGSLSATLPLLYTFSQSLDFGSPGIYGGGNQFVTTNDLSLSNMLLPLDIFVTQQFSQTAGSATSNGAVNANASTVPGSFNPNNAIYFKSTAYPEGLYTDTSFGENNLTYGVSVFPVPEPTGLALLCLPAFAVAIRRRSAKPVSNDGSTR